MLHMHGQGLPNDRMRRRRESPQVCCRHGADPDDMAGDIMTGNMFRIEMQPSSASLEADLAVEPPASTKFDAGIAAIQGLTRRLGAHQLSVVLPIGPRRTGMPRRPQHVRNRRMHFAYQCLTAFLDSVWLLPLAFRHDDRYIWSLENKSNVSSIPSGSIVVCCCAIVTKMPRLTLHFTVSSFKSVC